MVQNAAEAKLTKNDEILGVMSNYGVASGWANRNCYMSATLYRDDAKSPLQTKALSSNGFCGLVCFNTIPDISFENRVTPPRYF
jgi:hypothetical protein